MLNSDSYIDRLLNDEENEQKYLDESEEIYDEKYKALTME